jgi:hypothetical protein
VYLKCGGGTLILNPVGGNARSTATLTSSAYGIPTQTTIWYDDDSTSTHSISALNGNTLSAYYNNGTKTAKHILVGNSNPAIYAVSQSTDEAELNVEKWGNVEEVTITPNVTSIQSYAFSNSRLVRMVVPATVTSIGNCVFKDCSKLQFLAIECQFSVVQNANGILENCRELNTLHLNCTTSQYIGKISQWWGGTEKRENLKVRCTDGTVNSSGEVIS